MKKSRLIVCVLVLALLALTVEPSSCAVYLSINKGCGATYYPGETIGITYLVTGNPGDSIKVSLKVKLPDASESVHFVNKSILPNVYYSDSGLIGAQLGPRTVYLEWSKISATVGSAGIQTCIYNVTAGGGGGGGGGGTTLRIDSNVSYFQVWWDGFYNHTTPYNYAILYNVPSGTHTVTLKKSGCTDASKVITIIPGAANQVTINMDCGPGGGGTQTQDKDGDGVTDDKDACYNPTCNIVDSQGCPKDSDRDGLNDCDDECPREKGVPDTDGCPAADKDNDSVTDDKDACYNPDCALVDSQGCPRDSDTDGLNDCEDQCPSEAGERSNNGCPEEDSDSDGVTDDQDNCYNPGCTLVDSRGCPWDSDGDGLNDCEDNCPNQAGTRNNSGCPEQTQGPSFCVGTWLLAVLVAVGASLKLTLKK